MEEIQKHFNRLSGSKLVIRSLEPGDLKEMHRCFRESFADYKLNFRLGPEEFRLKFIKKLNIHYALSAGVFSGENLVAFVFHTLNQYRGQATLYNGGTGVIPAFRSRGLVAKMYESLLPLAMKEKVKVCLLEVLTDNYTAIRAYEHVGFTSCGILKCYKAKTLRQDRVNSDVEVRVVRKPEPAKYGYLGYPAPTFQDTNRQIVYNQDQQVLLEARQGGVVYGYILFAPATGRISQLAVKAEKQRQGIGTRLVSEAAILALHKPMTAINIRQENLTLRMFLESCGFENEVDQFEMEMQLPEISGDRQMHKPVKI